MNNLYFRIIKNYDFYLKNKIKLLSAYFIKSNGGNKIYKKYYKLVKDTRSILLQPVSQNEERRHKDYWGQLGVSVDIRTFRVCKNLIPAAPTTIVPESLYYSSIEPTLNRYLLTRFIAVKSFYEKWYDSDLFPKSILHRIDGAYYSTSLERLSDVDVERIIEKMAFPVVIKPNVYSGGGKGVRIAKSREELLSLLLDNNNVIVQEMVKQHHFVAQYHPESINTCRVYLYKSVRDDVIHVLHVTLRVGIGSPIDNEKAGGIHVYIGRDGKMSGNAVDYLGNTYESHPLTGVKFDRIMPYMQSLYRNSIDIAQKVHYCRIIGLDMYLDESGVWKAIEVNIDSATLRFAQYHGQPFFGEFTDEVIEYCRRNHWALTERSLHS